MHIGKGQQVINTPEYTKPAQRHISLYQLSLLILQLTQSMTVCMHGEDLDSVWHGEILGLGRIKSLNKAVIDFF